MEIVNGYVCKTCCDVDLAKKGVDPAHPKDGPYGIDSKAAKDKGQAGFGPAVSLGGALQGPGAAADGTNPGAVAQSSGAQGVAGQGAATSKAGPAVAASPPGLQPGGRVDLTA